MSGNMRETWCPILWMHIHTNKTLCSHARNYVGTIDKRQLTPMQVPYIQDHVTMVPQAYDLHLDSPACSIDTLFIIQTLLNQQIALRLHIISLMSGRSTFQFPVNDQQNWWIVKNLLNEVKHRHVIGHALKHDWSYSIFW